MERKCKIMERFIAMVVVAGLCLTLSACQSKQSLVELVTPDRARMSYIVQEAAFDYIGTANITGFVFSLEWDIVTHKAKKEDKDQIER